MRGFEKFLTGLGAFYFPITIAAVSVGTTIAWEEFKARKKESN